MSGVFCIHTRCPAGSTKHQLPVARQGSGSRSVSASAAASGVGPGSPGGPAAPTKSFVCPGT